MLSDMDTDDRVLIFKGLKALIERGEGDGFHNMDQGHHFYVFGANGQPPSPGDDDGPDKNELFYMLGSLNDSLEADGMARATWWYDFRDWKNFCKFAVEAHRRRRRDLQKS